jgi:hypothetical protein
MRFGMGRLYGNVSDIWNEWVCLNSGFGVVAGIHCGTFGSGFIELFREDLVPCA